MPQQEKWLEQERELLENILADYESGRVAHFDEDQTGKPDRNVTGERIASIRERLAHVCRKIGELGQK